MKKRGQEGFSSEMDDSDASNSAVEDDYSSGDSDSEQNSDDDESDNNNDDEERWSADGDEEEENRNLCMLVVIRNVMVELCSHMSVDTAIRTRIMTQRRSMRIRWSVWCVALSVSDKLPRTTTPKSESWS